MGDSASDGSLIVSDSSKKKKKGKLIREAEKYAENLEKRGVIYVSRVPPFMKPNKLRSLLEGYGDITRLYLAEEGNLFVLIIVSLLTQIILNLISFTTYIDELQRRRRKENGGNGSKQFSEGETRQYMISIKIR
jgi:ESF2/ABP1 family protein